MKNKDFYLICTALVITIVLMAVGYTKLSGKVKTTYDYYNGVNWNVSIINIEEVEIIGNAKSVEKPSFNNYSATFNTILEKPNDSIKYKITIKNNGNIPAKLNHFQFLPKTEKSDVILFTSENTIAGEILNPKEEKDFYIKVKYNSKEYEKAQSKTITAIYEYVQSE